MKARPRVKVKNIPTLKSVKPKKVAHSFLLSVPTARKYTIKSSYPGYVPPECYKVKNRMSDDVMRSLLAGGWKVEGKIWRQNNTTYGMVKGEEHIVVTDTGKPPYYLGDTMIEFRTCNRFEDIPVRLM